MLSHPAVQFYVDKGLLTQDEVLGLDVEGLNDLELQAISTPFFHQLVVNKVNRIELFQRFFSWPKAMESFIPIQSMIDEKKLPLKKALTLFDTGHLLIPVFRVFVINNYSVDNLSRKTPIRFENIQAMLDRKIITETCLFSMTERQIEAIAVFGGLIVNGILSLDKLLTLTPQQYNQLYAIRKIAAMSSMRIQTNIANNYFFESTNSQIIADKMELLLTNQHLTLDKLFNMPAFAVRFDYLDNRLSTLITHGRIDIAHLLTYEQYEKLQYNGIFQLILDGTLLLEQLSELSLYQCYQLEDQLIREQFYEGKLTLVQISQLENKQCFYTDTIANRLFFNPGRKSTQISSTTTKAVNFAADVSQTFNAAEGERGLTEVKDNISPDHYVMGVPR